MRCRTARDENFCTRQLRQGEATDQASMIWTIVADSVKTLAVARSASGVFALVFDVEENPEATEVTA
jgi:hypothetical protein